NPGILTALEENKRTKGVIIVITAQAVPHVGSSYDWVWRDPNLRETKFTTHFLRDVRSDISYNVQVTGKQLIFNYSTFRAIRATFFQRDSAYFAIRNTFDQVISTAKTQFYQVVVNRELIVV